MGVHGLQGVTVGEESANAGPAGDVVGDAEIGESETIL
jgi:hypothetical protein